MIVGWPSTKIAQIVPLRWTRWPPGLKIEKPLNNISSVTAWLILTKLHRNDRWVALYQNCPNLSALLNKMAARAKNRKTFKQHLLRNRLVDFDKTSQEWSLGGPLPKLPKSFRSKFAVGHIWPLHSGERSRAILALLSYMQIYTEQLSSVFVVYLFT